MSFRKTCLWVTLLLCGCGSSARVEPIAAPQEPLTDAWEAAASGPKDWPWWRGPTLDNMSPAREETAYPLEWSPEKNVVWKSEVPGHGHSSPSIWGEQVYVTTSNEDGESQSLLCFSRLDGALVWEKPLHEGGFMHQHRKNSQASATPACDGTHTYTAFMCHDGVWVSAVDTQGNIVWQTKAGDFTSRHGYGSSPILYESLVIVAGDNHGSGFLTALHRADGRIVWRIPRPNISSFATPVVLDIAGKPQLLLSGCEMVAGYDPNTGKRLWHCEGPTATTANTMAGAGDLVYASGGYPDKEIMCIRATATGDEDVTETHVVWRGHEGVAYVPSPLLHENRLYVVSDNGVLTCFHAETGEVVWKKRLGGGFSSSPILIGGRIYVANEAGTVFVVSPGDKYELLAKNTLEGGAFATPAPAGGQIFLRTTDALYCLQNLEGATDVARRETSVSPLLAGN